MPKPDLANVILFAVVLAAAFVLIRNPTLSSLGFNSYEES